MTADRLSLGSGPSASRIVLGTGAAMAVPSPERAGEATAGAPVSDRPPSPCPPRRWLRRPGGRPYGLVAAVLVASARGGYRLRDDALPFEPATRRPTAAPPAPDPPRARRRPHPRSPRALGAPVIRLHRPAAPAASSAERPQGAVSAQGHVGTRGPGAPVAPMSQLAPKASRRAPKAPAARRPRRKTAVGLQPQLLL